MSLLARTLQYVIVLVLSVARPRGRGVRPRRLRSAAGPTPSPRPASAPRTSGCSSPASRAARRRHRRQRLGLLGIIAIVAARRSTSPTSSPPSTRSWAAAAAAGRAPTAPGEPPATARPAEPSARRAASVTARRAPATRLAQRAAARDEALPHPVGRLRACRPHAASSAASSACTRSPGTLRWMSAFGSRSATTAGPLQPAQPPASGQAHRAVGRHRHPRPPAGRARRRCRRRAARPGPAARTVVAHAAATSRLVVLAQHVEGPHDAPARAAGQRHLEAADGEAQPGPLERARGRHPRRVDLDADDLDVGAHPPQPVVQLDGRDRRGAVAEVDDDRRAGLAPQPPRPAGRRASGRTGAAGWGSSSPG